jgi:hypothetical protein
VNATEDIDGSSPDDEPVDTFDASLLLDESTPCRRNLKTDWLAS